MKDKNNLNNEKGQAIFELVLFMPFLLYLITVIVNVGNSINASINQQKATRGFTYRYLKGNSNINTLVDLGNLDTTVTSTSAFITGWSSEKEGSETFYAPCFKFGRIAGDGLPDETCREPADESKSQFVRVFTFYGLCGESYIREGSFFRRNYRGRGMDSCNMR